MRSPLYYARPCSKCGAKSGERCRRQDGMPAARSHVNRTPVQPCGSYGGYQRHVRLGEKPCDGCSEANRRYQSDYRTKRPEVREADIAALRARREATRILIERHDVEFRALLADVQNGATA